MQLLGVILLGVASASFDVPTLEPGLSMPPAVPVHNASVPAHMRGGRNLQACTNDPGTTCMCTMTSYPCWANYDGTGCSCWSFSTPTRCASAGGQFCTRPTSCVANCALCQDTTRCDTCATGYMNLNGLCTLKPALASDTWVKVHNLFRCTTGAPPVTWNTDVAAGAQAYVNTLTRMVHSDCYRIPPPQGPAGENLAMGFSTLEDAASGWYMEYTACGPMPGCSTGATGVVGHFTAMVWRGVLQIGCGINTATNIYICRYWSGNTLSGASANMGGYYPQNVLAVSKTLAQCIAEFDGPTTAATTAAPTAAPTTAAPTAAPTTATPTAAPTTTRTSTVTWTSPVTTTAALTTPAPVFTPVDGGTNRACRGANATDVKASYYKLFDPACQHPDPAFRLATCQALCLNNTNCVGIQFALPSRCQVWVRPGGITTSVSSPGTTCQRRR